MRERVVSEDFLCGEEMIRDQPIDSSPFCQNSERV